MQRAQNLDAFFLCGLCVNDNIEFLDPISTPNFTMKTLHIFSLICLCVLGLATKAKGQQLNFQRIDNGLPTNVQALAANETSFFAAVSGYGIYRSTDNGASWQESWTKEDFNLQSLTATSFGAIAVGYDKDFLQMLVYRFDGQQWSPMTSFGTIGTTIRGIAERRGGTLYIATEEGFGVSADRGATWEIASLPAQSILSTLVETASGVFVSAGSDGVYSLPNGTSSTWTKLAPSGLPANASITALTALSNNLVALSNGAVFRSQNNGSSWETLTMGLPADAQVRSLTASGTASGTVLYAQVSSGNTVDIYLYTNGAWTRTSLRDIPTGAVLAANATTSACAVPFTGVFRAATGTAEWQERNTGLPRNVGITAFATSGIVPLGGTGIGTRTYLATQNGKVYLSSDNSASWRSFSDGLPSNQAVVSLAYMPLTQFPIPGALAGTSTGRLYRLADNSSTWQAITSFPSISGSIDVLLTAGATLLVGVATGDVFISRDVGTTWQQTLSQAGTVVGATMLGGSFFVATNGKGVMRSTDFGSTWRDFNAGLIALPESFGIQGIGNIDGMLYVGVEQSSLNFSASYRSAGSAAQWQQTNNIPVSKMVTTVLGSESSTFAATRAGNIFRVVGDDWQDVGRLENIQTFGAGDGIIVAGTKAGLFRASLNSSLTSVRTATASTSFSLSPNPCRAGEQVQLIFSQPKTGSVTVRIIDALGRMIATFPQGTMPSGENKISIAVPHQMAQGAYFISIDVDGVSSGTTPVIIRP